MRVDPYIAGIFFGDGCIYKRKDGAYCAWIDQADKNKVVLEREVIPRLTRMQLKPHFYRYHVAKGNVVKWRVLVYSKEFYMVMDEILRKATEYFKELSDMEATQFIAGLFDAEGTKTDRIVIYNRDINILSMVKWRLENLGIKNSHIYSFGSIYGLQIYRKPSVKKFLEIIPSCRLKAHLPG